MSQNRKYFGGASEEAEGKCFPGHIQKYADKNTQSVMVIQSHGLSCPEGKALGV